MRPQRRETPLRPGPGTVPALERQPRTPPVLGTATTAARLNHTTTPLNGADLAEVHAGYSRARSQDFRILTGRLPAHWPDHWRRTFLLAGHRAIGWQCHFQAGLSRLIGCRWAASGVKLDVPPVWGL